MKGVMLWSALSIFICHLTLVVEAGETVLSEVLDPKAKKPTPSTLQRTVRSYYDPRLYAYSGSTYPRPLYERLEYEQPARCGRCSEDRYAEEYDRRRGYDDDRRPYESHPYEKRPTYNRYDTSRYDRKRPEDRRPSDRKNGTTDAAESNEDKVIDDKDRRPSNRDRNRYDDRYRPDYNDRDRLRDPYRERPQYERYDDPYPERAEGMGYRRPAYDDGYDRGNGYDDGYGSYSPNAGRGPHDSFRPWDETYRGQAGWDDGGRGYYFAGGRPEAAAGGWGREYDRPVTSWQDVGYPAQRDPYERGASYQDPYRLDPYRADPYRQDVYRDPYRQDPYRQDPYRQDPYRQDPYRQDPYRQDPYRQDPYRQEANPYRPSGWHSVNERRPSNQQGTNGGVYRQSNRDQQNYNQNSYGQGGNSNQNTNRNPANSTPTSTSTTPGNSYLYEREDGHMTSMSETDSSTKAPPS